MFRPEAFIHQVVKYSSISTTRTFHHVLQYGVADILRQTQSHIGRLLTVFCKQTNPDRRFVSQEVQLYPICRHAGGYNRKQRTVSMSIYV